MTLPALLSVGWACVEIAHMSIVNQLSGSNSRRDKLVNNRNGFTAAANITVLGFALILFISVKNDVDQYRYLCYILIVIGLATSAFYLYTIKEVHMEREALILEHLY